MPIRPPYLFTALVEALAEPLLTALLTVPPKSHGGLTITTLGVRITFRLLG